MKRIKNEKKINALLEQHHIRDYFENSNLPFELYVFEKGEFLNNELDPVRYFTFVVSGSIRIIHIKDSGAMVEIASGNTFTMLGDFEFGSGELSPYLVEVLDTAQCIVLPLDQCRNTLENDPVFLRHLLKSLADKINAMTADIAEQRSTREKIIHYFQYACRDHILHGVEKASHTIGCSKRQLLRILKDLCDEGSVIRISKGTYQYR